jgi:hypothetical protein
MAEKADGVQNWHEMGWQAKSAIVSSIVFEYHRWMWTALFFCVLLVVMSKFLQGPFLSFPFMSGIRWRTFLLSTATAACQSGSCA